MLVCLPNSWAEISMMHVTVFGDRAFGRCWVTGVESPRLGLVAFRESPQMLPRPP